MENVEKIYHKESLLAIVVRSQFKNKGITFFTDDQASLQLGYLQYSEGHKVKPHVHKRLPRNISGTQEVLVVRAGEVKVTLFDTHKKFVTSTVLHTGDVIILLDGGHALTVRQDTEILEVKQGPYLGFDDKTYFSPEPMYRLDNGSPVG